MTDSKPPNNRYAVNPSLGLFEAPHTLKKMHRPYISELALFNNKRFLALIRSEKKLHLIGVSDSETCRDYFELAGISCENLNFCFPAQTD